LLKLGADNAMARTLENMKNDFKQEDWPFYLQTLDLDPKTMKPIYVPQQSFYFDQTKVKKYFQTARKPQYFSYLEGMMLLLRCRRTD
jgi:hypothetical protein